MHMRDTNRWVIDMTEAASEGRAWECFVEIFKDLGVTAANLAHFPSDDYWPDWFRSSMPTKLLDDFRDADLWEHDPFTRRRTRLSRSVRYVHNQPPYPWKSLTEPELTACQLVADGGFTRAHVHRCPDPSGIGERFVALWSDADHFGVLDGLGLTRSWTFAALLSAFVPPPTPYDDAGLLAVGYEMLSPREAEALALMSHGLRNADIAQHMGIAEVTVRMHLNSARHKMGAATREQALVLAMSRGLLPL